MRGLSKLAAAAALVAVCTALLAAFAAGATERGKLAYCRNNLRQLGLLAVNNWNTLDPARTGRAFWQEVRQAQYRDVKGNWRPIRPDPFVCPVHETTESAAGDPSRIDYRGPRRLRDAVRDTPKAEPIGADRPGNHSGGGGFVLRLDTSVDAVPPLLDAAGGSDPLWADAERALSD